MGPWLELQRQPQQRQLLHTDGSRPAFLIPSTLTVEVDGDEATNPLEAYDTKELVQELYRRVNA